MVLQELLGDEPKSTDVLKGEAGRHEISLLRAVSKSDGADIKNPNSED